MSEITQISKEQFSIIDAYALMRDSGANHTRAIETLKNNGWGQEAKILEFIHDDLEPQTYEKYFRKLSSPPVSNQEIGKAG